MYIIYKAFDDNTAEILDINTYARYSLSELDLIKFGKTHDVLGLSVGSNSINYITAYSCSSFPTDEEANEYIRENGLSYKNKRYVNGYYFVLEKTGITHHVDYCVCTYAGPEVTYIGEKGGYTPYVQGAKIFNKKEAQKKAALMTKNSKTGKKWTTYKVAY